jgi:hypothetical protein
MKTLVELAMPSDGKYLLPAFQLFHAAAAQSKAQRDTSL